MQFAITKHSNENDRGKGQHLENDWRLFCFVFCENYCAIKMDSFTLCYGFRRILYKMEQFFDVKSLKKSSQYLYSIWQKLVYSHFWKDGGISLVEEGKLWVVLPFPSYFIWKWQFINSFFYCVYQIFNPRYTLSNKYIAMKHYWKTYFYFLNLLAPFHILDLHLNMPIINRIIVKKDKLTF